MVRNLNVRRIVCSQTVDVFCQQLQAVCVDDSKRLVDSRKTGVHVSTEDKANPSFRSNDMHCQIGNLIGSVIKL